MTTTSTRPVSSDPRSDAARPPENVIIRPWPKVVFLYPTFVVTSVFFLLSSLDTNPRILGNTFLIVLCLNLFVFSFDFSRIKSITLLVSAIAIVLAVLFLNTKYQFADFLYHTVEKVDVQVNTQFYGFFAAGLGLILLLVFVNSRFNYYEVNAREILHHHGYLGDITRWSTDGLEMNKEIYDMVEYILLRSGRLIFLPASAKKAIVIDNVANVNRIEERVNDLLSHVAVRFNQRPGPG